MKYVYNAFCAALSCFLFCLSAAQAQTTLWGTLGNPSLPDLVYYTGLNGSAIEKPVAMGMDSTFGYGEPQLVRGRDGKIYGLNQNWNGYIFYKIDEDGVIPIHQFEYADGGEIIEGNDGFFYKFGSGATGDHIVISRIKPDGTERSARAFFQPYFRPDKLLLSDGAIYGLNTSGGTNQGSGFIYKFTPGADLSGLQIIYNFSGAAGRKPAGGLIEGADGFLYGVTTSGGSLDFGTIFKVSKDGSQYIKLHDFDFTNGRYPKTGLVRDASGWLYGTTTQGGIDRKGVIFKIRPDGTGYAVAHHFSRSYEGTAGELVFHNGYLYGYENASASHTTIFRLHTADNTYAKLTQAGFELGARARQTDNLLVVENPFTPDVYVTFPANNATGVPRNAKLVWKAIEGATLYTIEYGKTADFSGAVRSNQVSVPEYTLRDVDYSTRYYVRIRSNVWPAFGPVTSFTTEQVLASNNRITNPANGAVNVSAPTLKVTANVVSGARRYTIELSTSPEFTNPKTRTSPLDYQRTLTFDSLAYATTYYGRVKTDISGYGAVTSFTTRAETFASLSEPVHESSALDPLVVKLQVTTISGAKRYTVQLNTNESFSGQSIALTSLSDNQTTFIFKNLLHGTRYYARVRSDISTAFGPVTYFTTRHEIASKRLWGVASSGGVNDIGTVFSYSIDSARLVKHYDFLYPTTYPDDQEKLYGTIVPGPQGSFYFHSSTPGSSAYTGTIFSMSQQGEVQALIDIGLYQGRMMLASDNHIYATVDEHMGPGVIRKHHLGTNAYKQIFAFSGSARGTTPGVQLMELNDGYLYGTAVNGGINGGGTLYRIRHDGSGFQVIHFFSDAAQGSKPHGNLTAGSDGYLYGTTALGGIYGHGTVFKIMPDGTSFSKLFDFNGTNGKRPYGGVIVVNDVIYGTTGEGGPASQGTIFKINTNGTGFMNMYNFTGGSGYKPVAQLTAHGDNLYGMTSGGGNFSMGVIFRIHMSGSGFTKLYDLNPSSGGDPVGSLVLREDTFSPAAMAMRTSGDETVAIHVHPNPTTTNFIVEYLSGKEDEARAAITDMNGQVVDESIISSASPWQAGEALQKGIYILKVTRGEKTTLHRIVKK